MLNLGNLTPADKKIVGKRKGRGPGSGNGKTGGRGHKGQGQRSGGGVRPGFEGGQMPLQRRQPKRGFNNYKFATVYAIINVDTLEHKFNDGDVVNMETLLAKKIIRKPYDGLKVLANGELTKKLTVQATVFSAAAKEKITAVGGQAEEV